MPGMDNNKTQRWITVRDLNPVVRKANYRDLELGEAWPARRLTCLELNLVLSGVLEYQEVGKPPLRLRAGDVIFREPDVMHSFRRLDEPSHASFSIIMCELIPNARWADNDYRLIPEPKQVTHVGTASAIHDLFLRCCEAFEGQGLYRNELLGNLVSEVWIRLAEYWSPLRSSIHIPEPVRPMVDWLRAHITEPVNRQDLARVFHITPEHVNALFRRELDMTPTEFIHHERAHIAYRLIRDKGHSVKEAAAEVGFDDPFYFSRIFRRIFKRPPSSVRHAPRPPA